MLSRKNIVAVIIGFSIFLSVFFIKNYTILLDGLERNLQRFLFYYREPRFSDMSTYHNPYVSENIHIIGIDDDSLAIIGKWPWPRDVHAGFIRNLQQFTPLSIFIDVLFINPDAVPVSVRKRVAAKPMLQSQLEDLYRQGDQILATEIQKHHNIYIDQGLRSERRSGLPESYQKRIEYNENLLLQYSIPTESYDKPIFKGLEPIITPLVDHAHPVVINVFPDRDDVLRSFSLLHTYERENGELINVYSVVLSLLLRYYHVDPKNIRVTHDQVILQKATVPELDPKTKKQASFYASFEDISQSLKRTALPSDYTYNTNLYHYLLNYAKINAVLEDDLIFEYPITIDHQDNLIGGFEVYDALLKTRLKKVWVQRSHVRDFVINTQKNDKNMLHTFLINYSGRQEQLSPDPFNKERRLTNSTIKTTPYYRVSSMPTMPPLPRFDNDTGSVSQPYDQESLAQWFKDYTIEKLRELQNKVLAEYGNDDFASMIDYALNMNPHLGKFLFYDIYHNNGGDPSDANTYKDFVQILQEDEGLPISEEAVPLLNTKQMFLTLQEAYAEGFSLFHNKTVMMGMRTLGVAHDIHETPYGNMYGINTIANAFSTLVTENQLATTSFGYNFIFLMLFCLVAAIIHRFLSTWINFLFFVLCLFGTFMYAYILFKSNGLLVETTPLLFANALILILTIVYRVTTEERDRKFLKTTFSSYLSPELIDEMFQNKTMPTLGGETRMVTAFFTDIQGFSTFSEKLTAQQLVELLNEYLSEMTQILTDEKGTLDKYEGDAIIAFIGAPMDIPSHAYNTCKIAIRMQRKLLDLRKKWKQETYNSSIEKRNTKNIPYEEWAPNEKWPKIVHHMRMRIGINTGEIVVGNMGSQLRMNYTMMGDAVNLAARLEAAAKQYGVYTLISDATLEEEFEDNHGQQVVVKDLVEYRFIDKIIVVGRSKPVAVYELITFKGEATPQEKQLIDIFGKAMNLYLHMKWDEAIELFSKADKHETYPDSKKTPSQIFMDRCRHLKANPPLTTDGKWNGVWTLTEK